jgi:signal transduction histidine kinase
MFRSITTRLILAFLLVGLVVVALASGITRWLTEREFRQFAYDQALGRFAAEMSYYYQTHGGWDGIADYYQQRSVTFLRVEGPGDFALPQSEGPAGQPPLRAQTLFFSLADGSHHILIPAGAYQIGDLVPESIITGGAAVTVDEVRVGTALVVGDPPPLGGLELRYLTRSNIALLYAALGGLALALVLGVVLARALTNPIRDLTIAIRSLAAGDLSQRVTIRSKDELGELAAAFNQMSADLEHLVSSRRRMTADIAHDLRNPLTVIGGYVESMRDGVLESTPDRLDAVQAEVKHLQRLVDDLRTLSQAEAGELRLNREPAAPAQLLERMRRSYGPLAEKQGVGLRLAVQADLPDINIDPDRMAQVLGNLISNSLRYTAANGEIVLTAQREGASLILSVRDDGQGIAAEALPSIFDRFYRADSSRSRSEESGLGLAIAKSIVEAHGGSIAAKSSPGRGTTMAITLPL